MSPIELFTVNSSPAREVKLVSNLNKKSSQKKKGLMITEDSQVELSLSPSNCGTSRHYFAINKNEVRNSYDLEQTYGAQLGVIE